jgi:hypothetical protein
MRKITLLLTLAVSFLATASASTNAAPPDCGDSCPWVRVTNAAPPDCGDSCPWVRVTNAAPPDCGDSCPWVR